MNSQQPKSPEQIAFHFVEAWNDRDASRIAGLFDEHADFVNVTGLWWHDRASIERAHEYGLSRIFEHSHLEVLMHRVRSLTDDVAIVHALMRLSGQSAVDSIEKPGQRRTIFSFVVRRNDDGSWSCASAHNTDVVRGMETNVIDEHGTLHAVDYRSQKMQNADPVDQIGQASFPASDPPSWTGSSLS